MNTIIERFNKTKSNINSLNPLRPVNIIAVSKTFSLNYIMPLVEYGHIHYGENKVQEAYSKWNDLKNKIKIFNYTWLENCKAIKQKTL